MLSTKNLSSLPDISTLQCRLQQMAALSAIFDIEYGDPNFAFYPKWDHNSKVGVVKNGSGDELFAHFTANGCIIKGFAHESVMTPYRTKPPEFWPGLLASVPVEFSSSLHEPAFDINATTFVVWRLTDMDSWATDEIEFPDHYYGDGSEDLLGPLVMRSDEFAEWLEENYEADVDASIVASVFKHRPLTEAELKALNPDVKLPILKEAVSATDYPLA